MKNKTKSEGTSLGMRILRSEATRSIVSSVLCIIGGILVGAIILIFLAAFPRISLCPMRFRDF